MSFFSWFTSKAKTVDDIFDKDKGLLTQVGGWIGNANYSSEEQAEERAKMMLAAHQFVKDSLDESTERSKSRREIAVFFIKFFAGLVFMSGMTYPIDAEWSAVWFSLATSAGVAGLVAAISIFFFGTHLIRAQNSKK